MRRRLAIVVVVFLVLLTLAAAGPRPLVDETVHFDPATVPADLDGWLAGREAAIAGLKDGAQKEIVWADPATKARTPLAIVYIHGFSATKWETRPLPDKVAAGLSANLFFTRLTGHGGDGALLASASMNDWINDVAEAIAVGERVGEKVVIIGTSTGGTLAAWAAEQPQLMRKVAGIVLISPNFELRSASIGLLNMPWSQQILPMIYGDTRTFEPVNEGHAKWWTTSYPSQAVFALAALLKAVKDQDEELIMTPLLVFLSPQDQVVDPNATERRIRFWGGPKKLVEITDAGDPSQHVIAGDILSPQSTDEIADQIIRWAKSVAN